MVISLILVLFTGNYSNADFMQFISVGDFIDFYHKVKHKGVFNFLTRLRIGPQKRTLSKFNQIELCGSDFWTIPAVRQRWNQKCTGNPDLEYEDYVVQTYLKDKRNLRMLSVGCGTGSRERKFGRFPNFNVIEGIDLAARQIAEARKEAARLNLKHILYYIGSFEKFVFQNDAYDVVLFNMSLHHFNNIDALLHKKVMPLLKPGGLLIIFEYTGPKRLQWTREQINASNQLLRELPLKYRVRLNGLSPKNKVYRPGWLRMIMIDPSEAVDSEAIIPSLHKYFTILEEKQVGWNILHILLKDISHNFLDQSEEAPKLLQRLFEEEDEFIRKTGQSDAMFGIYKKVTSDNMTGYLKKVAVAEGSNQ